jgi:hypothetical protein
MLVYTEGNKMAFLILSGVCIYAHQEVKKNQGYAIHAHLNYIHCNNAS